MKNGNLSIEENAFFYSNNEHKTAIFEQSFEFDKAIDREKFEQALKETIKHFDRFGMKAVISKEGKPILVKNEAKLPIYEDNGQVYQIGTKETNGYLYAVSINGTSVRLTFFHLLCDGRGSGIFLKTLILYYIRFAYDENEAIAEIEKLNLTSETFKKNLNDIISPYVETNFKDEIGKSYEYIPEKDVFIVDKEAKNFYDNYYYNTSIEMDAKALIDVVHKYNTTPFVFFFMLIADAMIELYDIKNENIIANAAVDLRKFLDCDSSYNFGTSINVKYLTKWHDLPIEEKLSLLKDAFAEELDYKEIVLDMYKVEQMMDKIEMMQNVDWLKAKREENANKINLPLFTCFISNVGKATQPAIMEKHIKNLKTFSTPINVIPDYTIHTYGNTGIIMQNQNFQNESIMQNVYAKLESFGIKSHYIKERRIELSHFDTLKLERL